MSNVLDVLDQRTFDLGRAIGVNSLLQCVWVYDRPIDVAGLRQFHGHLERGRLARRIERSPLPFGRHRWIASEGEPDIEFVEQARPRDDLDAWLSEQVHAPLDCERGPGWHLAVLPLTDGGCVVSLVVSHCLIDGVGLCEALTDAALGRDDPTSWPAAASRGRWKALREDLGQTVRDIPAMGKAVTATVRMARRGRTGAGAAQPVPEPADEPVPAPEPPTRADDTTGSDGPDDAPAPVAMATMFVDAARWEARARELGGTNNALLVGVAARLAKRVGRVASDGTVVVGIPVNERVEGDTRANARTNVTVTVDSELATTDLREIRAAVKQALIRLQEQPAEEQAVNALIPVLPQRLLRAGSRSDSSNAVGSSNLGAIDAAASRVDGTDSKHFAIGVLPHFGMTEATLQRFGGVQTFLSGIVRGEVYITAASSQPGHPRSNEELRQELSRALSDFSLSGTSF